MKSQQIVLVSAIFLLTLINTCSALQTVNSIVITPQKRKFIYFRNLI